MKLLSGVTMPSSIRSIAVVSAMLATMLHEKVEASVYDKPYQCPESRYTAKVENYKANKDDEYVNYEGIKAPYNWDINHCGTIDSYLGTTIAFPGIIHYPPNVPPRVLSVNGYALNGHANDILYLYFSLISPSGVPGPIVFPQQPHPWKHAYYGTIDWDYDGVADWNIFGAAEKQAVQACKNEWFNSSNQGRWKLRQSYRTIKVHRPRNCAKDKAPQWSPGTGPYSPLSVWDDAGVPKDMQRRLTFSILNLPENPKYIAFFVNGLESCKGYPQGVTGSDDGWKVNIEGNDSNWRHSQNDGKCSNIPKRDPLGAKGYRWWSGDTNISKHSMAAQFMAQAGSPESYGQDLTVFPVEETLVISVLDTSFGYPGMPGLYNPAGSMGAGDMPKRCGVKNSSKDNYKLITGWINWLGHKVNWGNIKGFYGAGASRGGCFVTLIADRLFNDPDRLKGKRAKLILETFDPVCAPDELDPYRYTSGFSTDAELWNLANIIPIPGIAISLIAGAAVDDKTVLAASPLANIDGELNVQHPHPHPRQEGKPQYHYVNQCNMIKLHNMFGNTPREDIRWLNTVSGEDVLGHEGVAWTTIHAFCSDRTSGPAVDPNGNVVSLLENDSIIDTLAEDIKPKGMPIDYRFTKNEDGQPVVNGLPYQNLWFDFNNIAYVSGNTAYNGQPNPFVNPASYNGQYVQSPSVALMPNSNNPMPGFGSFSPACKSWYKQVWSPHSHMTVTGGVYVTANVGADGVGVPCFGQASCGYGVHEPKNPDGTFPLPLQKRESKVKACIPFPRADIDVHYKHAKHGHDAYVELFFGIEGDPNRVCQGDAFGTNSGEENPSGPASGLGGLDTTYSGTDIGSDGKLGPSRGDSYGGEFGSGITDGFSSSSGPSTTTDNGQWYDEKDGKFGTTDGVADPIGSGTTLGDNYSYLTGEFLAKQYDSYPILGESFQEAKTEDFIISATEDKRGETTDDSDNDAELVYNEETGEWDWSDVVYYK